MNNLCKLLPSTCKGILYILAGSILLMHTLGFLVPSLRLIIILGSIAVIIYGVSLLYAQETIKKNIQRVLGYIKKEK